MSSFVDRRLNPKNKSAVNRQRFLKRFHTQIRRAVADAISKRSVTDIESGEKVRIPSRDTSEPYFKHGPGGRREMVHPGNQKFVTGDRVARPEGGGGKGGGQGDDSTEGTDDFVFELTREEFLDYFFEDLELPNLVKTQLAREETPKSVRAGFTSDGVPANLHVLRSLRGALARRTALSGPHRREKLALEEELEALLPETDGNRTRIAVLREEIEALQRKIDAVPFIDTFDLRYRSRVQLPAPTSKAVMFCVMDVSGSMDQAKKDLAKRFFLLLYLFLRRNYDRIDVVFIRHHTIAQEVDEETFFYSRESGGTVVSSALNLMRDVIHERYPTREWNIYGAQASDGDNWPEDSGKCHTILSDEIMPSVQYYAYIEINNDNRQGLWAEYEKVEEAWPNFAMRAIYDASEIYPVFRELFQKQQA
ncbi:YeaH/YhbH family protein [Methylolobus aquaticus]